MLKRPQALRAVFLAAAVAMGLSPRASAIDLTWSADGLVPGGSGTWDLESTTWIDELLGGGSAVWDIEEFGGATFTGDPLDPNSVPATVTLGASLSATTLTFAVDGFTLAASSNPIHTLSLGSGIIAEGDATVAARLLFTGNQTWTIADGKTLTVSGDIANAGNLLSVTGDGDTLLSGALSGTGGLSKGGAGNLTLSGSNNFSGTTTLSAGTITLGNAAALASSTLDLATGGTGTLAFATTGTYQLGGLAGTRNLALGSNSLAVGGNNASTAYSGILSGTGGLTKAGTGTLTLSGVNTLSGKVAITGGAISVAAESGLGATPATATADALTLDGGALILTAGNQTFSANRGITLGAGGGTLDTSSIADTTGLSVTFAGAISGNGNLTVKAHGDLSASGGGGNTHVTLSGANTFTGTVTLSDGLVNAASGFGTAANTLRFANGGGLLHTAGTSTISRSIEVLSTGGIVRLYGGATLNLSGALTGSGTLSRTDGGTVNLTGDLSGFTGSFANLAGTTVIDTQGVSGLTGVTLTGGGLYIRHNPFALGSAAITVNGSATLGSNGSAGVALANTISIAGTNDLTLAGSNAAPYVQRGAVTGASSTLILGSAVTLAASGSSGSFLTIGESSGAILAHGFIGTYDTVRFAPINIGSQGVGMMIGGSLTATTQGQDNRDAQFAFLQAGGTATFGRLATGQTQSGSNAGGEGGISLYGLQGGTLSLGGVATGSGGGWGDRGLYLYATGGTMRATATSNWTPFLHVSAAGDGVAALDANGFNVTFTRNISGTGRLNLTGATGSVILNNLTAVTNSFSGSGALTKSNTSVTVFSGDFANYTGAFAISGGTAQFSSASDTAFAGAISGAGIFSKAGAGTLRLTGTNTWSSNAAITAGALSLASASSLPGWNAAGRWSVSAGATLAVGNAITDAQFETIRALSANFAAGSFSGFDTQLGDRTYAGTLSGAVGISKVGANTLTLTGASAFTGPIGAFGGTLNLGGSSLASAGTVTVAGGSLTGGRITTTTAVAAQSGNLGAALLGTGGVTKTTTGVISLTGVNSYTGATTVSAGTLVVESVDALPGWNRASGFSVASGAGIAVGNLFTDGQFTTMLGTGNFAAGSRIGFDTSAGDRTYGSVVANTGAGALGLVKSGTGTLYAAGASTFTGSVHVAGGTLAFSTLADSGSSNLGIGTALSLDGGTLRFTGTSATSTVRTLALTGSGNVIQVDAGGVLTLGPNATGVVSAWSGSGGVTKTGEGTLTVGNNRAGSTNRFHVGADTGGVFTMAEGVLNINPTQYLTFGENNQDALFLQTGGTVNTSLSNGSYIGNGGGLYSASLIITGGTFNQSQDWMRVGNNGYARGFLTIGGGTGPAVANVNQVQLGSGSRYASGTLTLLSGGTLVANTVNRGNGTAVAIFDGGTLRANSNTSNLLSGVATVIRSGGAILDDGGFTVTIAQGLNADGVGSGGLAKLGSGTLRLVGVNTYAGNTALNAGTLTAFSADSLPGWNVAGRWSAAAGTTLAVGNGFASSQVASLVATGNLAAGAFLGFDTADGNRVFAGAVADGANGALAVTKIGANTLTLSGSSTYTGLTTVANGTLELASRTALADATNTQVRSGATLMFEVSGTGDFTNADLATLLPSLYDASGVTGLRAGSFLGFDTEAGSFSLETAITNSSGANGGSVGLVKIGANTLTLTGANTYGGATTVSGGSLALDSGASITSGGNLILSGGAFLDLGGGTSTFGAVTVSALASSGSVIRNGTLAASNLTFNHASGTDTLGANLNVSGRVAMMAAGTLEIASGTHNLGYFDLYNSGRITLSGGQTTASARGFIGTGTLTISGGTHSMQGFRGGEGSGTTSVINQSGGTLTITGTTKQVGLNNSFVLNHWSASGTYNLSGGTLNVLNTNVLLHWDGTGTFNQSGGTANLHGLDFNTSRGSAAAYNLTGGRLNIGADGIVANNTNETFTAGAATLGALADWSTVKTISLTDATTGLTVNTSDAATGAARTITLSGILSGTGRLTVAGTGVVNLNAANTNTGLITVSGGALRLSNANSLAGGIGATGGTGALSLNGGVIDLAAGDFSRALGTGAGQVAFAGSGGFAATGAARTVNLGGAGAQVTWGAGSFIPNGGELLLGHANANNTVTLVNPIALGASDRTVNVARGTGTMDGVLSGALTGDGGLVKTGEGLLSLTGTNTYAGNTTVSAGVLSIGGTSALSGWDSAGRWSVAAGATLAATNAFTDANVDTLLATGNFGAGAAIGFDTTAGDRTYATALADTAAGSLALTKVGANTLVLSGANTHTGATNVLGGTLRLSHASALASSTLNMSGGSVAFDSSVAGNAFTAGGLAGTGNLALQNNAGTPAAITLTVGGNNASTTYAGTLSGAGSLIKSGSGTLTLAGAGNTHVGATTVSAGTLVLQTGLSGALVAEAGTTITVQHASGLAGLYSANGGGGAAADLVSLATLDTKMLGTAVTVAQSSSARGANFDFATNGSGFPAPYNSGAGGFVARWNGQFFAETTGTYTFFTASDDGSKIWINGQEVVSNNFAQGVTERSGTITLEAGWHDITAGFMNISGGYGLYANVTTPTQAKAALSNSLLRSAPIVGSLTTAAGSTLDLGSVGLVVNQTGTTTAAGALVGSGSFTKVGNGTLTLGDVDGFTGGIAVHAGQLVVSGDLALGTRSLAVGPASDSNLSRGLVLSGVVSGTSGLTKSGNGVLALTNAANTFSGGITNLTGVLAASSDGALGDAANQITLGNGATFRSTGTFSSARTLALAAGPSATNIQVTAGNTFTFAGTFLDASATTQIIKSDNGTLALGAITAPNWSGSLNQLNDPTALTGGLRVDAGVLRIDSSSALSASNVVVVNNYQGAAVEIADGVNLAASVVANINASNSAQGLWHGFGLGNLFVSSGTGTLSGELNLRQDAGIGAAAGATLNIAGNIRLTGHILSVLGAGTVNLSGTFVNAPTGLNKLGSGNLNITSAVPIFTATGMYLLGGGGTTTFSGAGSIASGWTAGGLNVRGGDSLVVDNSGTNLANRLGGAAAFVGRDATLRLVNSASSANLETLGVLTAAHGYTRIVVDTTAQDSLLSFASLSGNIPNGGGTLVFEAAGTGANFGTAANTVRFRNAMPGSPTSAPGQYVISRAFVIDGLGTNFAQYSNGSIRGFQAYDTSDLNALSAPGVSPTAAWTPTLQLSASATLGAHRTVNALKLTGGGLVLGGSGSALTLQSGGLLATGGTSTLAAGSFIQGGGTEIWIGVADGSTLNLEGAVNTSNIITKGLGGTLNISAPIYSTGSWYILNGGTTNLLADNVLYSGQGVGGSTQNLSIAYGATLDLRGTSQTVSLLHAPSNNQYAGVSGLLTNTSEDKALFVTNSTGSGDLFPGVRITGNMAVVHGGTRTRYFYSDNTYTGRTAIMNNALVLNDEGRFSGTSGVDVNYGGRLYIRNTGSLDLADRVNDAAALTLRGGGLEFNGRAQTASSETVGAVTLAQGWNSFLVNSSGIGVFSSDLVLSSLSATGGVMNTEGINSQPGSASRLRVQDNAVGAINGIVPYAVNGRELVGYVADQGFSFLGAAGFPTYGATSLTSGLNPTLNVKSTATTGVTLSSNTSVNSLLWNYGNSNPTLTLGSNTLTLTAGVLALATSYNSTTFTVTGGFLQSATSDLYIHKLNYNGSNRRATISSVIQDGTAGATRLIVSSADAAGSSNYLTLTATNTYTGGTVINGGQVQLGGGVGTVVLPAGGVTLNGGTLTVVTNGGQIAAANTVTLNGPAQLVLAGANTLEQLVFNNTGGTGTPTVSGGTTLNLAGATAILANGYNPSSISTVSSILDFGGAAKTITVNSLAYDGKDFAPYLPNLHLSGVVQNAGLVTVNGGGVLQLSGASTFTGGYSVAAGTGIAIGASSTGAVTSGPLGTGTLTLASGARLQSTGGHTVANAVSVNGEVDFEGVTGLTLSGGVTLAANGTFDIQAPQPTLTLSGVVAGAGRTLTKTGYGTLSLTGANTFDGGTTVSRGTLSLGNAAALGTGTLTLSGGALDSSVANLTLSTNNAQTWSGGFNFTGTQNLNLGTGAVTLGADISVGVSANTLTVGGAIGDAGANRGLTKVGNGILRLTGTNTYGGTTAIDAGVLAINSTAALPGWDTAGRVVVRNGAALAVGASVTDADVATMLATGNFASGGAIGFDVATADRTYSSALTGTMGLAVLDTDTAATNVLVLSGNNDFSGGTTVYSGTLRLSNQNALRGSVATLRGGSVVFDSSVAGNAFAFGGLAGTANLALQNNAGTPAAIALTVGSANTDTVYTGVLSGAGSLTKVGTGTLTLAGANSFTGNVLVSGGTLRAASGSAFGAGNTANTKVTVAAGAAVDIMGSALVHGFTIAGTGVGGTGAITNTGAPVGPGSAQISNIRLSANASIGGSMNWALLSGSYAANSLDLAGFTLTKTGVNTIGLATTTVTAGLIQVDAGFINFGGGLGGSGVTAASTSIVLSNASGAGLIVSRDSSIGSLAGGGASGGNLALNGGTFTVGGLNTNTSFAGVISGGGNLTKTGTGTLTLSGASSHTGATTLSAGSILLASSGALGSTTLNLNAGSLGFAAGLGSASLGALGGSANLALQDTAGTPAAVALTIGANNATTTYSGILSGAGSLTKVGTGNQTLSGANTFTGGVAVNAGTLTLSSGAALPGLAVAGRNNVASGATLALANGVSDADLANIATVTGWSSGSFLGLDTSAGNRTYADALAGDFALSKIGGNTLTLSGNNSFTGGLAVRAGTVLVSDLAALPGSTVAGRNTVASGATLAFGNGVAEADFLAAAAAATVTSGGFVGLDTTLGDRSLAASLSGGLGLAKNGANTLTLTSGGTFTGPLSINDGTLLLGGANTLGSGTYAGAITLASGATFSVGTSANQTLSGGITGSGTVSKSGLGTLTLSHASSSPAAINLTEGTLALGSVLAAQHALINVGAAGAQRLTFTVAGTNTYTVGGLQGSDSVDLGANSLTVGGNNLTSTFDGALIGTGALSKVGSGTFTLNAASSLIGNVNAGAGSIWLGGDGPTVRGNLIISGSGAAVRTSRANQFLATTEINGTTAAGAWNRLELYGNNQVAAGLITGNTTTLGGGVVQNSEASGLAGVPVTLTLAGSGSYVFNGHFRNNNTNTSIAPLFLNKTGSGTQSLYGTVISYTGMTTVTGGTLLLSLSSNSFASPINNQATVTFDNTTAWNTTVALGGSGTYNKTGANALQFVGSQIISTTGQINIQAGTLQNNNNAVNWAANRADVAISAGAILDLYADAIFLDVLSGAGTVQSTYGGNSSALSSIGVQSFERLVLGNNSGTGSFAGLIRNNPTNAAVANNVNAGGLRLDKLGSGTQTFTTAHTYTGGTWVGGGTLELDFTGLTTPTNLLSASGALLLNGGTLSIKGKAASATAQTFAGLTLAAGGGQLLVNPNGATSATVTLGGLTATAAGGSALVGLAPAAGAGTLAITTTSAATDGIFSGRLVYTDGTNFDFAGTDSGATPFTLGALATYADLAGAAATTNARITASASVAANQTVKTLKVQAPAASQSLEIATGQTLSVAAGLLFTGTEAFSVTGGTLAGGNGSGGAQDLVIHQYNAGGVTIGSTVGNNGANATALTKAGTGALTLSANATYTGTTFLNAGTLTFGGTSASTALQVAGGTLVLNGVAAATTYNLNGGTVRVGAAGVVAAGAILNVNSGTFDLSGQNITVTNLGAGGVLGTVTDNAAGTGTSTLAVTGYTNSTYTLFADGATRKLALSLTNANSAPFLLNPSNTFSGGLLLRNSATGTRLSIDRPVFNTGSAGAIVSSPFGRGTITIGEAATDKAQFYVSISSVTILNDIIFNTGLGTDRPGAFRNDAHGLLLAGTLTANLAPVTLSGNANGTTRITGRITGPEGLWARQNSFVTTAVQTVVLDNQTGQANDYLGATTIDTNQVIRLAANEQLPDGGGFGNVTVNGTLNLYGNSETINGLTGSGIVEGGNAIPRLRVGSGDANGSFSGIIRNSIGTLSLEKIGSGIQFLSGANTYSGTTTVSGGVLAVASASSLPGWNTSGLVTVASGGALALSNAFTDADIATFLATPALASGSSLGFDTSSGNRTYAVSITNTSRGALGLVKVGANTLTLSGTNTYSGLTSVREGVLAVSSSALPNWSAGDFRVASGAGLAVGNTVSDAAFAAALATGNFAAGSLAGFDTTDGDRSYGTAISDLAVGSLGLVKTGANSLTISGASTFTGVTQVLGGTLRLGNASALGTTAAGVTVASAGTLDLNGLAVGAEAVTLSGSLVNDGASAASLSGGVTLAAASTFGGSGDLTLSGIVTGSGALTKSGAGRAILTGVNTASGNLAITAGTLEVGGSGQLNSGTYAGTIANAGTLAISTSANQTLSGVVSGAGSLLKSGVGELTLSAANTFSGGVVVSSGTLRLSNNNAAAGTGTITLGDAATGSADVSLLTGQSPRTFNNNIVVSAQGTGLATIGSDNGSGGQPIIYAGALTLNRAVTLHGSSPDRTTYTGKISGNVGTLTISGSRTTIDNNTNDFVGAIVISSGATLQINGDTAIPAGTAVTATGLLSLNTGAVAIGSLSGSGTVSAITAGARVLTIGSDNTSTAFSGVISNNAGTVGITKAGNGTLTLSGINTFTGNIAVNAGTLSLTGANTVSGNVTVSNGTLRIAGTGSIWSATKATAGALTVNSGGVLEGDKWGWGVGQSLGQLNFNPGYIAVNGGTIRNVAATSTSFNNRGVSIGASGITYENATEGTVFTIASGGNASTYTTGAQVTLGGLGGGDYQQAISGTSVSLVKSGAGTWTLSGAATHTGATTVNNGTLLLTGTIGASSAITVNDGATLRMGGTDKWGGHTTTTSSAITLNAGSKFQSNGFFNTLVGLNLAGGAVELTGGSNTTFPALALKGTVTVSGSQASTISAVSGSNNLINLGPTDVAGAVTFAVADVTSSAAADLTVAAVLQNNRNTGSTAWLDNGLTKTGAGTLVLDAANTYTGATTVSAGTLRLGAAGSLAASTALSVASDATLDLNGRSQQVAALNGSGSVTLGAGQLTVSGSADSTFEGSLGGTGSLVKSGSGSLVLASTLDHTGGTILTAGTLEFAASDVLDDASSLTVQGGTLNLGLNDDTVGALAISGGTVTGIGTLTAASIAVSNATGTVLVETVLATTGQLVKTGAGTLDIRSSLAIDGGLRVSEGIVTLANGGALGAEDAVVVDGGSLNIGAAAQTYGSLSLSAGSLLGTGSITAGSYAFSNSANVEVSIDLLGDGDLVKTGGGTLTLTGNNVFTGGLTVNGGLVDIASLDSLGSGAVNVGESGSIRLGLNLAGDTDLSEIFTGGFSGAGQLDLDVTSGGTVSLGGDSTFGGTVVLSSGVFDSAGFSGDVVFAGGQLLNPNTFSGTTTVTGVITDLSQLPTSGTLILDQGGSIDFGSTAFSGAITYRGGSVSGAGFTGTLNVEGSNIAISGSFGNGKLSVGAGSSIVLDGATTGTVVFAGGAITGGANLTGTLEVGNGRALVIGQGLDVFGSGATLALASGSSLDLAGSASQGTIAFAGGSLANAANFAGTIAVSGGATLSTDGTVGGTVTLAEGTTLAGNGTFTGTVTAGAGSVLAPGSSPGLTTYGTLNLTGGSVLQLEFFSTTENISGVGRGYDAIQATTLNFGTAGDVGGGTILLQLATLANWSDSVTDWNAANGFTPLEGSSLIHTVPGESKDFIIGRFSESDRVLLLSDGLNVTSWFAFDTDLYEGTGASSFQVFAFQGDNSNWELTLRVVPEPSTYGLILGALALAGAAVRRRRQKLAR